MEEIWKDVPGYEGSYIVSNTGRVVSKSRLVKIKSKWGQNTSYKLKGRELKGNKCGGYLTVDLCDMNNIKKKIGIHRLVAIAFLPNPYNLPHVNHRDESRDNNCINNLEWCTAKYNTNYGTAQQRKLSKIDYLSVAKKNSKSVLQYDKKMNFIKKWESARVAGKELGISENDIRSVCYKLRKTYKGFIWMLEEPKHEYTYNR